MSGPLPQRIPVITYPKFEDSCHSLLKKHLSRDIWSNMKKKSTSKGGNIQLCVKSGVQMPSNPIGIMASDEEAYRQFNDLFGPIIKDLHPKFDFRYSYKFEEISMASLKAKIDDLNKQHRNCESLKFRLHRNFRGMPFTPLMTKEAKLQIERKVVEVLGELYGKYQQLQHLTAEELDTIHTRKGIDLKRLPIHDAAGINDDYPVGRGIFTEDSFEFFVLVNFEDHVEIVVAPEHAAQNGINNALTKLLKLNSTFDKIGFATDAYLGYLSVSPQNLGTGLTIEATIKIAGDINKPEGAQVLEDQLNEHLCYSKSI